ncbi:hypothetical protein Efla_006972 [Eimeria flavescens]
MAHAMHSIITELIGDMHSTTSKIGDSCYVVIFCHPNWPSLLAVSSRTVLALVLQPSHDNLDMESSYALTGSRRETREHAWNPKRWTAFQLGASAYHNRGRIQRPSFAANPVFLEPPVTFHAVQYPKDRWLHPHGDRHRKGRFDFVTYYVHQRFPTSSCVEYEQATSSSGDDQPPSPQQQVQETIPNRLIRTRRAREDNLDNGLLDPSARRQRARILPASATDLFPPSSNDREREESEDAEKQRERIRRGDAPGARSPRVPNPYATKLSRRAGPIWCNRSTSSARLSLPGHAGE